MQKELDQVYRTGQFRILYTTRPESPHAIPPTPDINHNQIPDYVENIAIQARATIQALEHLGFVHPLKSPRYKDQAHFIDIHIKEMNRNGTAFELAQYNRYLRKTKNSQCALIVAVRKDLKNFPGTWSLVTHELFHLYQYAYSQFKTSWYLEGMANWAERILRKDIEQKYLTPLPQTQQQFKSDVYQVAYNHLWHRLGYLAEKK